MSLKKNIIDSISLGLEDYNNVETDPKRVLSATRNLYSGILLLFKHKIGLLDPKQNLKKLNLKDIKSTLSKHQIDIDSEELTAIQEFRNDIEHHSSLVPLEDRAILVSNIFIVLHDFIENVLQEDAKEFLGKKNYHVLLTAHDVYEAEQKEATAHTEKQLTPNYGLSNIIRESYCPKCNEDFKLLYTPEIIDLEKLNTQNIVCKFCSSSFCIGDFLDDKSTYSHREIMQGAPGNRSNKIIPCLFCDAGHIIIEDARCNECEQEIFTTCLLCKENNIDLDDDDALSSGICSRCSYINYQLDKND